MKSPNVVRQMKYLCERETPVPVIQIILWYLLLIGLFIWGWL